MPFGNELASSLPEEKFQNQTLRPILKWQNELLLEVFRNYASKQKGVFFSLSPEKKEAYIENVIQKDIKFRNTIKGIVIGLFSLEEFQDYIKNSSNLNKRMMNLVIERLKSQSMVI
ncbi:glyoxalase [Flavobacterium sp. 20NA77.7]|uniref:Glyoxalase n=2 Tax=Flavobacterium nakdongensis TaxID=3073563 RepID=A0ABY9RC77_9FLAO|nr:glyoxalase [Flavobacterium sp. 20NA77.7]WMW78862.1 glyoxalase [Flavobacterium sp. 20NA77.7]